MKQYIGLLCRRSVGLCTLMQHIENDLYFSQYPRSNDFYFDPTIYTAF